MSAQTGFLCGRYGAISISILCLSALAARADLFISEFNHDVVYHYNSANSLVNQSSILQPSGLALGPDGNLYVGTAIDDGFGNGAAVVRFDPGTGAAINTFASHVSDNNFNNPGGLAFDSSGNLYVGDLQNKILVYNSAGGSNVTMLTDLNLSAPSGLTFAPDGTLYVADENTGSVLKYNSGVFSVVNTSGAQLNIPHDVVVGLDGNLYVLDAGIKTGIYQLNPLTGFASLLVDYSTNFFTANDLALGLDGNLYVSGVDGNTGDGVILQYGTNGVGGSVYLNLGSGTYPTYMLFAPVPEPAAVALVAVAGTTLVAWRMRRKNSSS